MSESGDTTVMLQGLLDRIAAGDAAALEELIGKAKERLLTIARKLLRGFGGEARVEMWTADVLGEAYPRLAKALDDVRPSSPAQFFGLARLQMQRALLDCVRDKEGRGAAKASAGSRHFRSVRSRTKKAQVRGARPSAPTTSGTGCSSSTCWRPSASCPTTRPKRCG